jgi:hypothetical protein
MNWQCWKDGSLTRHYSLLEELRRASWSTTFPGIVFIAVPTCLTHRQCTHLNTVELLDVQIALVQTVELANSIQVGSF